MHKQIKNKELINQFQSTGRLFDAYRKAGFLIQNGYLERQTQ